jgi:hypothetical protein
MIYIVSPLDQTETAQNAKNYTWYAYFSDAKTKAQHFANVNERPFYIYSFEQCDCIEPKEPEPLKTYKLTFSKVDKTDMTIKAQNLEEAVKLGAAKVGKGWELYSGYLATDD